MQGEGNNFKSYIYSRWFVGSIATSWKLTKNPTLARIAAERAGRRVFNEIFGAGKKWTLKSWVEVAKKDIHEALGTNVNFAEGEDQVLMYVQECPFRDVMKLDRYATCSFHYGTWRSAFRKAFPDGELLLGESLLPEVISKGASECKFKFLLNASDEDRMLAMKQRRDLFID
ncbi:MAG: hypothetical protein V3V92_00020 [Candidatus Hydrothermarchaeales archaeon]